MPVGLPLQLHTLWALRPPHKADCCILHNIKMIELKASKFLLTLSFPCGIWEAKGKIFGEILLRKLEEKGKKYRILKSDICLPSEAELMVEC